MRVQLIACIATTRSGKRRLSISRGVQWEKCSWCWTALAITALLPTIASSSSTNCHNSALSAYTKWKCCCCTRQARPSTKLARVRVHCCICRALSPKRPSNTSARTTFRTLYCSCVSTIRVQLSANRSKAWSSVSPRHFFLVHYCLSWPFWSIRLGLLMFAKIVRLAGGWTTKNVFLAYTSKTTKRCQTCR